MGGTTWTKNMKSYFEAALPTVISVMVHLENLFPAIKNKKFLFFIFNLLVHGVNSLILIAIFLLISFAFFNPLPWLLHFKQLRTVRFTVNQSWKNILS